MTLPCTYLIYHERGMNMFIVRQKGREFYNATTLDLLFTARCALNDMDAREAFCLFIAQNYPGIGFVWSNR